MPARSRSSPRRASRPGPSVAAIGEACLTLRGVVCQSCRDACPTARHPLRTRLRARRRGRASTLDACTGCGACVAGCPTAAITVREPLRRPMADELHVSSLVVHGRPERLAAHPRPASRASSGVEVHAAAPSGKLVVTLETASEQEIVARLATISLLEGVLSATLVFHQVEPIERQGDKRHGAVAPQHAQGQGRRGRRHRGRDRSGRPKPPTSPSARISRSNGRRHPAASAARAAA